MPNPLVNNKLNKKYIGQGTEVPSFESSLQSFLQPQQEQRPVNIPLPGSEEDRGRYKHAAKIRGGVQGQGRPFEQPKRGNFGGFRGASNGLPPGLGIGGGNSLQALIENRLRKRKKFELPQAESTQNRMLGRYLGGGESGY